MATVDETGKPMGENFSEVVRQLKESLDAIAIDASTPYRKEREQNKDLFSSLISDLEKAIGEGFKEGQKDQEKYIKDMTESLENMAQDINAGDIKNLRKKQQELRKEEKKLASFQLMKAFHKEQSNQLEKQTNILQQILTSFTNGIPTGIPVNPITTPASTSSSSSSRSNIAEDMSGDSQSFVSRLLGLRKGDKFDPSDFMRGYSKTPSEIIFGNQSPFKGIMAQLQSVSKNLLAIGEHQSLLQVLTEGTVESQLKYEQSMREALYLTAGATKESTELFKSMAKIGNTVELTGFKQEETQKAMVKFAKMGVKYDGDSERYKKKLLSLSTTTLNTEKQLGLEAGSLQETFGDLYRFGVLNENSIANLGRGMREVSRTTGVSGEAFKKVLSTTQGIVDAMRKASTLTASSARNITELGANAEKFGVSDEFNNINKALASTTNLFNDASEGTRMLLFSAAASVGKLEELQAGTLTRSKEGIKSLTEGVNNVFKRFGIESADSIDQLSDSAKMQLNLVLKSSFDLELGQVKGVLKTLEASGKTFADKLLDLDKQLGKNISTEKRSAILEEQRKIKIDKNLDLLGILSEAAETSKTMNDAFSKFGTRRKEFESDLQALGLGGSNKDIIRQAIDKSLTGVNAALSKAGLKEISISATEMAKALEDPQAYQDLLSTLKDAENKGAANAKGTLTGIDAVRFGIDKLNATVQDAISGPLSSFLNQGVTGILAANAAILFMPAIMGKLMSSTLMQKFLGKPSADVGGGGSGGGGGGDRGSGGPTGGGAGRTKSWSRFGRESGQGALTFAGGWLKFAASTLVMAGLLYGGFQLLKGMKAVPEDEIEDLLSKVKYLGIGIGAATVMMGEVYLATMAMQGMTKMMRKINPKSFLALALGIPILAAAAYFVPPFIVALADFASASFQNVDLEKVGKTAQDVGSLMASGALLIGSLVASVLMIGGTGYVAMALMNPIGIIGTIAALGGGALIIAAAANYLPPFIKSIADLSDASIKSNNINPAQIQKSLNSLMAIIEPFSKLLGFVALIGASLAGIAVGGLVGGAIGASAYLLGEAVSMISGGMIKNYGDVNVVISETLRHYFSLINSTNSAIVAYMGALTPAQVISSLNKLQSFNEANKLSGIVLKDFALSFGSAVPAYVSIASLSNKLVGIPVNTPDEIANKFRGIINIMQGINIVGVELEKNQAANSTSQTNALKDMMYNLVNNAIPLFDALSKIQQVTSSKEYQTVSSSQATFAKASKVLKNITPHLAEVLRNIHDISTKVYEELKDLNLQNIKEGSDAATSVVGLFNQFIDSAKISGKDLSIKKIREFSDTFGNPEMVNSLRTVMQSTVSIAKIFNEEGSSVLDLASISSRTKYYSEFYSAVGDIMSSYGKMSTTFKKPESSASGMTQGNFWLGLNQLYGITKGGTWFSANKTAKEEFEAQMKAQEATSPLNPAKIEESLKQSFAVITAMTKVTQDKSIIPSVNDTAATRVALLGLMSGMKVIAEFSNLFDVGIIKSTTELFKNLELIPEVGGAKLFGKIGMSMTGMISALQNMVANSKQFVEAGSKDFVKMSEVFSDLKEPLEKLNDVFGELSKLTGIQKTPDFWKNFIDSFPNTDSAELSKRMGFLKSYIVEMNKLVEPSFMSAIMSLGKIQGLSIDSKTSSAIELLSNLNNFMNALKTQVGNATVPNSGEKKLVSFDISGMTKFLTENAIPVLNSVKEIAEKLNNLPLNKTQLEQASAKMNLLGQLGTGLTDFSVNFYKSADFFTKQVRKTREVDGKTEVYGRYEDTSKQREEFFANNINQLDENIKKDKATVKSLQEKLTLAQAPDAKGKPTKGGWGEIHADLKKAQEKLVASNQAYFDATRPGVLPTGIPEKTTWVESFETQGDKMKAMFENPKLKEGFSIIGKLPSFFKDNILDPFIAGGGAQLRASNIQFISGALTGIKDIIKVISGDDGLITLIEVQLKTLASTSNINGGDRLKQATDVLNDLGKGDAFSSFLNSLLVNIILPMRFAARISGGSKNLNEATASFVQMQTLIAGLPVFFKLINTELPKMGKEKSGSNLNAAISNINSIKDTLPKFLETLSYGIILPAVTKLPPIAFIAQASKRLKLATDLGDALAPFINKFAAMNATIGGNFEKINLVDSLGSLITKLNPADEALSTLADKLITVKESLQSIADSMTTIMSINDQSGIVNVLSSLSALPNNIAEKAKNAINLTSVDSVKTKVELSNVQNQKPQSDPATETTAENTEKMKEQQRNMIAALQGILAALITPAKSSNNNVNTSTSNTGAINLNSGTGSGQGGGNAFQSAAFAGNNMNAPANYT